MTVSKEECNMTCVQFIKQFKPLALLKLIGIALFIWIIIRIDRAALISQLQETEALLIVASFIPLAISYLLKSMRWHMLVQTTGLQPSFIESWRLYTTGLFLGTITPGKLGELGRAVYLRKMGVSKLVAVMLVVFERIIDAIVIVLLASVGAGILFGWMWTAAILTVALVSLFIINRIFHNQINQLVSAVPKRTARNIFVITLIAWCFYFAWAITLTESVGISLPVVTLLAVFTIGGIVSLLPIAPSGLGTREATLITLLAPFGIGSDKAVALALLMLTMTVVMNGIGGWHWMRGKNV
ncbi:flippase-like domain-containing protein [Patescibacteria group bacterium]|nr:flippase-like domain-containing protein [Patescibacteria group bacterium]